MYVHFDLPPIGRVPGELHSYWLHTFFIRAASERFEIKALANTYVRLVGAAVEEYKSGSVHLREFWGPDRTELRLGAMHRAISHFESCIFSANRAINCFRRLRGDKRHDPLAIALRRHRFEFAGDAVADRIRDMRNEIHHLENSVMNGTVGEEHNFALRPTGPEVPHATEAGQTVLTIDRLEIGAHAILFGELVVWLREMAGVVPKIVEAISAHAAEGASGAQDEAVE